MPAFFQYKKMKLGFDKFLCGAVEYTLQKATE
jgi:hypothetical protein